MNHITHKRFLVLGFSPGLGVLLNAVVNRLQQNNVPTKFVGEVAMSAKIPTSFKVEPEVLAKVIEYENKFYNPENNLNFKRQIENYALRCLYHLKNYMKTGGFTDLLVWNGEPIFFQAGIHWAKQFNINIWYMENGALPGTLQLDKTGVNVASSITVKGKKFFASHGLSFDTNLTPPEHFPHPNKFFHPFEMFMRYINRFGWYWSIKRIFWKNWLPDQKGKYLRRNLPIDKIDLPEKFIFVPLQVQDDTQILIYSSIIKTMTELVEQVYWANKRANTNLPIIVKEHPHDFGRQNYDVLRQKYPDIIWLKDFPINELLDKTSVVITINSGVGIEALTFEKPVITLGDAFYNVEGLVYHAKDLEELPKLITESITQPVDRKFIDNYLGYLQKRHLIRGGWKKFSSDTLDTIVKRLLV